MKLTYLPLLILAAILPWSGCQKEELILPVDPQEEFLLDLGDRSPIETPCADISVTLFKDASGNNLPGGIRFGNGETMAYVGFDSRRIGALTKTRLYVGDCNTIPTDAMGNPDVDAFPYQQDHNPGVIEKIYNIPLASLPDCYCIVAYAEVDLIVNGQVVGTETMFAGNIDFPGANNGATYNSYCAASCTPCSIGHRTQTPGGWGAPPNGNNPGMYVHANFAAAFPGGLVVGCNNTITLTSAQAVTDFLPSGGNSKPWNQSYVDPTSNLGALAGHIVALRLSLTFDAYDPNFSVSGTSLSDLVLGGGALSGLTVTEALAEAESYMGGCGSSYNKGQLINAISSINENFVDGLGDNGFLVCP